MRTNIGVSIQRLVTILLFSAIAGTGSLVWAAHGHGGGGGGWSGGHGGGVSWSGGHSGGHGWSGGHANFSHFSGGHSGFNNHWNGGHFSSGYHFHSYPYRYSYLPYVYSYFGYPYLYNYAYPYYYSYYTNPGYYGSYPTYYDSYPADYFGNDDYYAGDARLPQQYVVSRPVMDIARLEVRLPDPQATIWVEGKEIASSGAVRQFKSPQLDPAHEYTYTVKAEWHADGKIISDERSINVRPNDQFVVDFTKPAPIAADAGGPALPDLPPPQPRPSK
jgi:uncharacterized protein (TIGR03000 family)